MSEKTKVFNIIKNITAILFSVAILVTGIIVVKRIAEIKQTTKMFQDGVELEDLGSYTDISYDVYFDSLWSYFLKGYGKKEQ